MTQDYKLGEKYDSSKFIDAKEGNLPKKEDYVRIEEINFFEIENERTFPYLYYLKSPKVFKEFMDNYYLNVNKEKENFECCLASCGYPIHSGKKMANIETITQRIAFEKMSFIGGKSLEEVNATIDVYEKRIENLLEYDIKVINEGIIFDKEIDLLQTAIMHKHKLCISNLTCNEGINVNYQNYEGESAIFIAVQTFDVEIVSFLLSFGTVTDKHKCVDLDLKNNLGYTVFEKCFKISKIVWSNEMNVSNKNSLFDIIMLFYERNCDCSNILKLIADSRIQEYVIWVTKFFKRCIIDCPDDELKDCFDKIMEWLEPDIANEFETICGDIFFAKLVKSVENIEENKKAFLFDDGNSEGGCFAGFCCSIQ
eukprot:TRINITY_DN9233_c0_g1_i1.p1 TRINITY_DN9233_c0_g1~~TRINITY_DN9233_c0_g1_i1.p1  ORF type:complete len:368 (+),score=101.35 TRINITY_DN9233_c0_g1_i1:71-1174(+)